MSEYVCLCCGAELVPGMMRSPTGIAHCPNCLVTLLKPEDYEEVNDDGEHQHTGS